MGRSHRGRPAGDRRVRALRRSVPRNHAAYSRSTTIQSGQHLTIITSEVRKEPMSRFVRRGSQWIQITLIGLLTAACSSTGRQTAKMSPAAIEDKAFQLE